MSKETPLQAMKRLHGSKDKLVDSVAKACQREGEELDETKARLRAVSNKKLLRLAEVQKTVTDKFGGVDKLVDGLASALGRAKDAPYVAKLRTFSSGKLVDMMSAAQKRRGRKAA